MSGIPTPASAIACLTSLMNHDRWCLAVSLGRKPSPGGALNVWRTLERTCAGFPGAGWQMTPIPSLLALPSRPMAIISRIGDLSKVGL